MFASREKFDELRDKKEGEMDDRRRLSRDDYLDWWQTSKKEKQKQ